VFGPDLLGSRLRVLRVAQAHERHARVPPADPLPDPGRHRPVAEHQATTGVLADVGEPVENVVAEPFRAEQVKRVLPGLARRRLAEQVGERGDHETAEQPGR
jgi:hypothetical protein